MTENRDKFRTFMSHDLLLNNYCAAQDQKEEESQDLDEN